MDKNDYGYQPSKNTLLAMFDADLLSYDGKVPTIVGACGIDKIQYPDKTKSSLHTPSSGAIRYNITPIGTSDFTVDFWMRYQAGYSGMSVMTTTGVRGFTINMDTWIGTNNSGFGIGPTIKYETRWVHYALVRQAGWHYRFIGGKLVASINAAVQNLVNNRIAVNARYTDGYHGGPCNYKAVRLCNFARWTSDFTPPVAVLKRDNNLYLKDNAVYGIQ